MKNKIYRFRDHLREQLQDPEFKKEWQKTEAKYLLACKIIETRLSQKMSQRQLAKKAKTTQTVISRVESMSVNPSVDLLQRIAAALGKNLTISFRRL